MELAELVKGALPGPLAARRLSLLAALENERAAAQRDAAYKMVSARRVDNPLMLELEPQCAKGKSTAIDESLIDCRAVWFDESKGRDDVVVVNPEQSEVTLRFVQGPPPAAGKLF